MRVKKQIMGGRVKKKRAVSAALLACLAAFEEKNHPITGLQTILDRIIMNPMKDRMLRRLCVTRHPLENELFGGMDHGT